jgi:hypothetical protein
MANQCAQALPSPRVPHTRSAVVRGRDQVVRVAHKLRQQQVGGVAWLADGVRLVYTAVAVAALECEAGSAVQFMDGCGTAIV